MITPELSPRLREAINRRGRWLARDAELAGRHEVQHLLASARFHGWVLHEKYHSPLSEPELARAVVRAARGRPA